jgi:hypothetical protein
LKSGSLNPLEPSGPLQACNGIVYLYEKTVLGVDMGDVEEITDSPGEELTDKEKINLKETKVSVKIEAQARERK